MFVGLGVYIHLYIPGMFFKASKNVKIGVRGLYRSFSFLRDFFLIWTNCLFIQYGFDAAVVAEEEKR